MTNSDWLTALTAFLAALLLVPVPAVAAPDLVDVCHQTADAAPDEHVWRLIQVNAKSVEKHLEHGDVLAGNTVPGTTRYLDHDCNLFDIDPQNPPQPSEPPAPDPTVPSEVVFAVAYSDMDPSDGGYNPEVDVLISKLIDGPDAAGDGVPGAGDLIVTGEYPEDFGPVLFGTFEVGEHTVTGVAPGGYVCTAQTLDGVFVWSTGQGSFDQYQEWSSVETITRLYDNRSSSTGQDDEILINPASPSQPASDLTLSGSDLSDQAFIDADVECNG